MASLSYLLQQLGDIQADGASVGGDPEITGVTGDSRCVRAGHLFVATRGAQFDGHEFISDAVQNGAVAVIGEMAPGELSPTPSKEIAYIQVTGSRRALARCAAALHGFPSQRMIVVGVTGTDGKTTTCAILESILRVATRDSKYARGRVGVITTVGTRIQGEESDTGFHVTTPDAPQVQAFLAKMVAAGCTHAIVESTSHGLDQGRVDAVEFDVAAVTNITHEHLDYHGSRAAYVQAKAQLFRKLAEPGKKEPSRPVAVLNADDHGSFVALQSALDDAAAHGVSQPVQRRSYGILHGAGSVKPLARSADVVASEIGILPNRTTFVLSWWQGQFRIETGLIGEFNIYNILCAATVALALGISAEAIRSGVEEMKGVVGRMERIDCGQPFLALVDFAHSPVSLERALATLRPLVQVGERGEPGRLIAVFGCAGLRDVEKRKLMGRVSGRLADYTVVTAEDPRTEDLDAINQAIANGLLESTNAEQFTIIPDRLAAIQYAVDMAVSGDVVAAFGKGHERSMCFGTTEYPWSDQAAMADALKRRAYQAPDSA